MARRRFFVDEVRGGRAQVLGGDAHHLTRVLRVEAGQKYEISDNRGVYLAEIEIARKDLVSFTVLDTLAPKSIPVDTTLAVALIKFERFEWLIEKATEMGVSRIVPMIAERCERGLDHAVSKRLVRWRRIAHEASEQSRRDRLPEIGEPLCLIDATQISADVRLMLEESHGATPILSAIAPSAGASVAIVTGPEGGWTDRERSILEEAAWKPVSLGETILRTETAALAAAAIVAAAWNARKQTSGSVPE